MRIFRNCQEAVKEIDRELKVSGVTVPIKHYQNQKLEGADQNTKELMGVSFTISKPTLGKDEMLQYVFPKEWEKIKNYCEQEFKDRTCGEALNPGNSYKIRLDLWQKFLVKDSEVTKFDYTYPERFVRCDQIQNAVNSLRDDIHSRRSLIQIFQADLDSHLTSGFESRVPCSVDYQLLIRNNRLYCVYHMRSSDFYGHFPIDIYLTSKLMEYFVEQLLPTYPDLKVGSLLFFSGSLHAYSWSLNEHVVF